MGEFDNAIRNSVQGLEDLAVQKAASRRLEAERSQIFEDQRRRERDVRSASEKQEADVLLGIISKFAVWATDNAIDYNSPSRRARGWVLGRRSSAPSYASGVDSAYTTHYSSRLLIVDSGEDLFEIYKDYYTPYRNSNGRLSPKFYYDRKPYGEGAWARPIHQSLLAHETDPGAPNRFAIPLLQYGTDQVVASIAQLSYESGVKWE